MGAAEKNKVLSERRGSAVYEYIIRKGIDAPSLRSDGFGEEWPWAGNDIVEVRKRNMRVEMRSGYE